MKTGNWKGMIVLFAFIMSCGGSNVKTAQVEKAGTTEDVMVQDLAEKIHAKHGILEGKKIAVTHFMSLDGREVPEGKRLSRKLLEELMAKGDLQFVERADMADILKIKEIELSGLVDEGDTAAGASVVPVDVAIGGTIAATGRSAELFVKVTDIKTGQIYLALSRDFIPGDKLSYSDDNESIRIHRSNPDVFDKINTTYSLLMNISDKRPMVFLMAVAEKKDPLLRQNREVARKLRFAIQRLRRNRPEQFKRLVQLRDDVELIKKHDPRRYGELVAIKKKILAEDLKP